jgi:hypothetical protein
MKIDFSNFNRAQQFVRCNTVVFRAAARMGHFNSVLAAEVIFKEFNDMLVTFFSSCLFRPLMLRESSYYPSTFLVPTNIVPNLHLRHLPPQKSLNEDFTSQEQVCYSEPKELSPTIIETFDRNVTIKGA